MHLTVDIGILEVPPGLAEQPGGRRARAPRADAGQCTCMLRAHVKCLEALAALEPPNAGIGPLCKAMGVTAQRVQAAWACRAAQVSLVDHRPQELLALTVAGVGLRYGAGLGPAGDFSRLRLTIDSVQADDQMFGSRRAARAARARLASA